MKPDANSPQRPPLSQGGIIQTYQKYDPQRFPSPTQPPPDLVSPAFEHWLAYGSRRELTAEELARAIHLDPSQIQGLGPSLDALLAMLRERKAKILQTYETDSVTAEVLAAWQQVVQATRVPRRYRGEPKSINWSDSGMPWATISHPLHGNCCGSWNAWANATKSRNWRPATSFRDGRR
jgi:hypothetical protein